MKLSHNDLALSLADHLRAAKDAPMIWTDMQLGPSGSPRPDVYAIPKTYTALRPIIYEVKVSVSDFRADVTAGKWQSYRPMCSGIYFAFPDDLAVSLADVPAECGVIRFNASTGKWRAARKPVLRPIDTLPVKVWQKLLIDGVNRAHEAYRKSALHEHNLSQSLRKRFGEEVANFLRDSQAARERLEEAKAGTHWEIQHIKESAKLSIDRARSDARRELDVERSGVDRTICEARDILGVPADADSSAVLSKMRQALSLLAGDMHTIETAKQRLTAANDALSVFTDLVKSAAKKGEQHA